MIERTIWRAVGKRLRRAWRVTPLVVAIAMLSPASALGQDFQDRFEALAERDDLAPAERLDALFELDWERNMAWSPEWATWVGWKAADHGAWTDLSLEAIERRDRRRGDPMVVLEAIDRDALSPEDRLSYDLFLRDLEMDLEGMRFPDHLMPVTQLGGVHQQSANLLAAMPARTEADIEAILSRLSGLPEAIHQTIALMEEGLERGVTQPRIALRDVPDQVAALIVEDPLESPMLRAFRERPEAIPETRWGMLRMRAIDSYEEAIAPALDHFRRFLADTYLPGARESIAAASLPDGEAWYTYRARRSTTTDLTPREIHEIGLAEVERIRAEMEAVIASTAKARAADPDAPDGDDFEAFAEWLRTDPRFYHDDAEALLAGYRDIAKRADPELASLFGVLPRLPYGVKAVPSFAEKSQTTAYYQRGSPEAGRPGWFYANTYALDTRPKWEMEALTLHEAVPGHHLQIAIAQELEGLPTFRRYTGPTAFVEGWGLYAESLGEEMGFYEDPYSKFGQLTYEMWRAVRLVVDTGMHAFGWDRQRAIDFFAANSSKSLHDITVEIDRYIVWPGQALAYKMGELKIKELRARARKALGERFDVREFHDVVLGAGALPLEILERRVDEWIAETAGAPTAD